MTEKLYIRGDLGTASSANVTISSSTSSAFRGVEIISGSSYSGPTNDPAVERAVYTHIQALRSLGQERVTPEEVSRALNISVGAATNALRQLASKGVRQVR